MPLCASCGTSREAGEFCPHHADTEGKDWAKVNRIMCRGLHEGIWPERLSAKDREEHNNE